MRWHRSRVVGYISDQNNDPYLTESTETHSKKVIMLWGKIKLKQVEKDREDGMGSWAYGGRAPILHKVSQADIRRASIPEQKQLFPSFLSKQ